MLAEGERAANAARGLQPGEYDIFKNRFCRKFSLWAIR